jgi:hypothetical protein
LPVINVIGENHEGLERIVESAQNTGTLATISVVGELLRKRS